MHAGDILILNHDFLCYLKCRFDWCPEFNLSVHTPVCVPGARGPATSPTDRSYWANSLTICNTSGSCSAARVFSVENLCSSLSSFPSHFSDRRDAGMSGKDCFSLSFISVKAATSRPSWKRRHVCDPRASMRYLRNCHSPTPCAFRPLVGVPTGWGSLHLSPFCRLHEGRGAEPRVQSSTSCCS